MRNRNLLRANLFRAREMSVPKMEHMGRNMLPYIRTLQSEAARPRPHLAKALNTDLPLTSCHPERKRRILPTVISVLY